MHYAKTVNICIYDLYHQYSNGTKTNIESNNLDAIIAKIIFQHLGIPYNLNEDCNNKTNFNFNHIVLTVENYKYATYPIQIIDYTFGVKKPGYMIKGFGFLQTFSPSVWLGILLTVILMTLFHYLLFRGRQIPILSAFFYISSSVIGQSRDWTPKTLAQRILVLTWSICTTFIILSYTTVLLSFMTVPTREKGIETFHDLSHALRERRIKVTRIYRENMYLEFMKSPVESISFVGHQASKSPGLTFAADIFEKVSRQKYAIIASRLILERLFFSTDHIVSKESTTVKLTSALDYTEYRSNLGKINDAILRLHASGIFQKIQNFNKHSVKIRLHDMFRNTHLVPQDPVRPLSLANLSGAFSLLLVGHFLGVVCLLFEILAGRSPRKSKLMK